MIETAPKKRLRRWLGWGVGIAFLLAVLYCGAFIYVFVLGGSLGPAKLVHTDVCGNGDYRLLLYNYGNGSGYQVLTDRAGRVFGKAEFSMSEAAGPIRWDSTCREVLVGSDEGLVILKVRD